MTRSDRPKKRLRFPLNLLLLEERALMAVTVMNNLSDTVLVGKLDLSQPIAPATTLENGTITASGVASTAPSPIVPFTSSLLVTSFKATSTGFVATFNEAINPATLNLYTTSAVNLGPADVSLVGASTGPIFGSLIVDSSDTIVTFIQTRGLLAADTYTITLRSATNGFVDPSGNLLSGNGTTPGTNYTTTFTVAPSNARVIGLPDFARGPGQPVNIPASSSGLPLTISDGTGVTSIRLTLTYNPALLTVTGANLGSSAPAGSSVTINTSTPGSAVVVFNSPTALPAGLDTFATLIASVPNAAPYTDKEALVIGGISINGGAIVGIDNDGVHAVAYVGDTKGIGGYSSQNVTLLRRVIVGLDSGFAAYPLLDPTIVGDILGTGFLNSQDVTILTQYLVGFPEPLIPDVPNVTIVQGADPLVWIPQTLLGAQSSAVTVPVKFRQTNATAIDLNSADIAVGYDPALFTVSDVRLGDVPQGWTLNDSVDPATGAVLISIRSASGALSLKPGFEGSLVLIDLAIRPDAALGTARINLLGHARVGSRVFSTSLNGGHLTLTPAPSDSDFDPVDGLVTIASSMSSPANRKRATVPTPVLPDPSIRSGPTSASPPLPAAVDVALDGLQVNRVVASQSGGFLAFETPQSTTSSSLGLIPWTSDDPSAIASPATSGTSKKTKK